MRLAIVIPVLNEAPIIEAALARLADLRARGARVIVVDGGSRDDTVRRAAALADRVVEGPRGRALQMNAGANAPEAADCDVLLFLHADTVLPPDADRIIFRRLSNADRVWGRFDVNIDSDLRLLRVVETLMNWRSRLTGIATGDQAIFVERGTFLALQGFTPIPLMEDIEFCRRAKRISPPLALAARVTTSGRRWQRHGVWRTIALMWKLRLYYFFGADPGALARMYRDAR
jgi:rSAM/selenodomain-associated transferase 2